MKFEVSDEMPERESWAWLREMLDVLDDKVLKLFVTPDQLKKTRTACHNWSYRFSDKKIVTSTTRDNGGYVLYVRVK